MDINDMTIRDAANLAGIFNKSAPSGVPFQVGKAYLIRTVTMTWTGVVQGVFDGFLVLDQAAWIADTGRYNEAVKNGTVSEVEPVPDNAIIGIGSIVDAVPWSHCLPVEVK